MKVEVVAVRLTILTFFSLLAGCNEKEPAGATNEEYPSAPAGLAFSAPGGQLTFFRVSDGQQEGIFALGQWSVTCAAINLQGNRLFVADGSHSRIGVISLPDLTELNSISVGGVPMDLQINASGAYAYVITQNSNFWVYSISSGQADTLEIGNAPRRVAIRPPYGVQAWIACAGDSTVRVVELQNLYSTDTLQFNLRPSAVAFSPDGVRAYVALGSTPGIISVIEATTFEALGEIQAGTGPFELAMSSDGRYLAAADSAGSRTRIWNLDSEHHWNILTGGIAGRVRYSPGTNSFFVCSSELNEVLKIDLSSGIPTVTDTITIAPYLRELVLWESPL